MIRAVGDNAAALLQFTEEVIALGEHLAEEFTSRITAAVSAAGFLTE